MHPLLYTQPPAPETSLVPMTRHWKEASGKDDFTLDPPLTLFIQVFSEEIEPHLQQIHPALYRWEEMKASFPIGLLPSMDITRTLKLQWKNKEEMMSVKSPCVTGTRLILLQINVITLYMHRKDSPGTYSDTLKFFPENFA